MAVAGDRVQIPGKTLDGPSLRQTRDGKAHALPDVVVLPRRTWDISPAMQLGVSAAEHAWFLADEPLQAWVVVPRPIVAPAASPARQSTLGPMRPSTSPLFSRPVDLWVH